MNPSPALLRLAIVSDVHYAGAAERRRGDYCARSIGHPLRRGAIAAYRRFIWLRDPFAHNALLDRFLDAAGEPDLVVANGDYSCDSAFVGVADDAARDSAAECLGKLRARFGAKLHATIGDHELGKKPLGADLGGLRLAGYHRTERELNVRPFWTLTFGRYVMIGVTSTLLALPIFVSETLPEELESWQKLRADHFEQLRAVFAALQPAQKVLLFCHDPSALPFLWAEPAIRARLGQIERTIIGHLHSRLVFWHSRLLAGMPAINFLGHTPRRLSTALREARCWKHFNVLLCPSLAGIELLKDGGYYTARLDPSARQAAEFQFHPLRRA